MSICRFKRYGQALIGERAVCPAGRSRDLLLIMQSVFRLAARHTRFAGWTLRPVSAPVSEKRVELSRCRAGPPMGVLPDRVGSERLFGLPSPVRARARRASERVLATAPPGHELDPASGSHASPERGRPLPIPPKWVSQSNAVGTLT